MCSIKWEKWHYIPSIPISVSVHLKPDSVKEPHLILVCHMKSLCVCVCGYFYLLVWTCFARATIAFFPVNFFFPVPNSHLVCNVKQRVGDNFSVSLFPPIPPSDHRTETLQSSQQSCSFLLFSEHDSSHLQNATEWKLLIEYGNRCIYPWLNLPTIGSVSLKED